MQGIFTYRCIGTYVQFGLYCSTVSSITILLIWIHYYNAAYKFESRPISSNDLTYLHTALPRASCTRVKASTLEICTGACKKDCNFANDLGCSEVAKSRFPLARASPYIPYRRLDSRNSLNLFRARLSGGGNEEEYWMVGHTTHDPILECSGMLTNGSHYIRTWSDLTMQQ